MLKPSSLATPICAPHSEPLFGPLSDPLSGPLPLPPRRSFTYDPPQSPIDIIYEAADYIIVNKPAGLLSVPGKTQPDCLEARLKAQYPLLLTVHRLDMATSGLMIFALTPQAQRHLGLQFEKRQIEKTYMAQVYGHVADDKGRIELPLIADWPNRPRQKICHQSGKAALTDWEVIRRDTASTRLALYPKTGRSHQLRVHMHALGHPILGDRIYAIDPIFEAAPRLMLQACEIAFREPSGGGAVHYSLAANF